MSVFREINILKWETNSYSRFGFEYSGGWLSDYFLDFEDLMDAEIRYKVYEELLEVHK